MRIIFFLTSCSLLRRNLAPPEMEWSYVLVPVFEHGESYENTSTIHFFLVGGCYWGLHPMKLMDNWLCTQKSILLMLRVPCGDRTQVSCVHDKHISQCSIALTLIFTHWDMEQLRTVRTKFQPSDPGMLIMVGKERPYSPQSYLLGCIWKLDFAFF